MPKSLAAIGVVIDGPLNPLILDALAEPKSGRRVGAEVEPVAEHAGQTIWAVDGLPAFPATVAVAIDALVDHSVSGSAGGPWTCESDAQEPYSWSGAEDPSAPLRKGLGIEVATDQEGTNDWEGRAGVSFPVSALAGTGSIDSTGAGAVTFPASVLAGGGFTPYEGSGAVEFAVSALSSTGEHPYTGTGDVSLPVSALAGTGTIDSTGTGDVTLPVSASAGTGTLTVFASGDVTFAAALAGTSELADTGK